MQLITTAVKNKVLASMMEELDQRRNKILEENQKDLKAFDRNDQALYDRLVVDDRKIDGMIQAVQAVMDQEDPVGQIISETTLSSGLQVINKTDPFGTILIIYESRPDVTIEAAVLAFKANNKILLKGGKEAHHSNQILVECWHDALRAHDLAEDWITFLNLNRKETQQFLANPPIKLDLIVPRGGEHLISFVKEHATCAVLVSGRGNNYLYVSDQADWTKTLKVILNAKTDKISACNALDKVLLQESMPDFENKVTELSSALQEEQVEVLIDPSLQAQLPDCPVIPTLQVWDEEFLSLKIMLASVTSLSEAIEKINHHSGHHSSVIMTESSIEAKEFMEQVDSAAVYQNASSRFTDGGAMGVGAELAISTDKLHHRGPLGLKQLVTNKYYVFGDGHIRE